MNSKTQDKENYTDRSNRSPPSNANDEPRKPTIVDLNSDRGKAPQLPPSSPPPVAAGSIPILAREGLYKEISKQVVRQKLQKLRHLVVKGAINPEYLDALFPALLERFHPQTVTYNGGVAKIKEWKISCYLEVMEGGIPCTDPNTGLLEDVFRPLLDVCDDLFLEWYRQQHAGNASSSSNSFVSAKKRTCRRLMTFVTRYTPAPGEQALLKHVDGAGKVDGSVVVALPIDRWSAPHEVNSFEGHGGGLTFWDGRERVDLVDDGEKDRQEPPPTSDDGTPCAQPPPTATMMAPPPKKGTTTRSVVRPREIHYETRSGDLAFIDRAVWHQADPITKGTRWALVIFYKVE
jgi:hypothetical protein